MTAFVSCSNPELAAENDGIAIVARELRAQLGTKTLAVVEGWANGRIATYATPFWRKVIDEVRRTDAR